MIQCALNNGLNQRFQLEAVEGEEGYYYLIPGHAKEKVLQMGDVYKRQANGVKYVYQYDLIDRLTGVDADNGQQQRFVYDTKNRLESYLNKVEGETVKTKFVYGNPEELSLIHI